MSGAWSRFAIDRGRRTDLTVFAIYALLAFLYFGLRLLLESGNVYLGVGSDPLAFIWCFGWWPHAILHGENPLVAHSIWAPNGVNLIWTTSVPGLALLFAPVTLLFGPVISYNVATVLLPALAASTGFLLCRHLTHAVWPSFVGGYLFGFSTYVLGQEVGHPHMTAVFLVPLVALVCVRFVEGELDGRGLALRLGPLLGLEFLISTEVTFTLILAVFVALLLGILFVPARRQRLVALVGPFVAGSAFAALLTAPFVYYAIAGFESGALHAPTFFVTDLLNFAVPTDISLASFGWAKGIYTQFPGNDAERGAYLGIPVLVIVGLFARRRGRAPSARFLLAALAIAIVCSLGFRLTVDGHASLWLPWSIVGKWSLFDNVLPERLVMYVALVTSVIVALWTAAQPSGLLRWLLPGLAVLALVPNPNVSGWATHYSVPAFFTDSAYRTCLDPNETILPLPVSAASESMLWQAADDFRFQMAGGNIAPDPPASFLKPPAIGQIAWGSSLTASQVPMLEAYIKAKHVTSVVVDAGMVSEWEGALDRIGTPERLGGVVVYHISDGSPSCLGSA